MQIGDTVIFHVEYKDRAGNLADPDTVSGQVSDPDRILHTISMVKQSTGVYEGVFDIIKEGEHWFRTSSTGSINSANEKRFDVATRRVG